MAVESGNPRRTFRLRSVFSTFPTDRTFEFKLEIKGATFCRAAINNYCVHCPIKRAKKTMYSSDNFHPSLICINSLRQEAAIHSASLPADSGSRYIRDILVQIDRIQSKTGSTGWT
ncbi:hypothetical protein EMCRGX_G007663 [Ephydatia muelleri]